LKHLPGGHCEDSFMPAPLDTTGGKSVNEAWFHSLDSCVMRNCFFGGAMHAVLLLQKGHNDRPRKGRQFAPEQEWQELLPHLPLGKSSPL
jgi:hypothetical protein